MIPLFVGVRPLSRRITTSSLLIGAMLQFVKETHTWSQANRPIRHFQIMNMTRNYKSNIAINKNMAKQTHFSETEWADFLERVGGGRDGALPI